MKFFLLTVVLALAACGGASDREATEMVSYADVAPPPQAPNRAAEGVAATGAQPNPRSPNAAFPNPTASATDTTRRPIR
ncbi:MAG TPA: hypothetical protein VD962_11730, partial [Rubricoccaceae bacterium]|nr:hypothetical protein [Rubricoccaceae bacterium]